MYFIALISLPFIIVILLLVLERPWVGVLLLILLQATLAASSAEFTIFEFAFLGLEVWVIFAWIVKRFMMQRRGIQLDRLSIGVILFLGALAIGSLYPVLKGVEFEKAAADAFPFFLISMAFIVAYEFHSTSRLRALTYAYLAASTFVAVQCITLAALNGDPFANPTLGEINTPFNSALYLFGFPVALGVLLTSRTPHGRGVAFLIVSVHVWRSLIGFRRQPLVIMVAALFLVPHFINRLSGGTHAHLFSVKRLFKVGVILSACVGIGMLISGSLIENYLHRFRPEVIMYGLGSRLGTNLVAFDYFLESPVLGKGFGFEADLTTIVSQLGLDADARYRQVSLNEVHSLYFYLLMHLGLTGFLSAAYVFWRAVRSAVTVTMQQGIGRLHQVWISSAVAILLTVFMLGFLSVKSFSLEAWMALGIVIGMLFPVQRHWLESRDHRS